MNVLPQSSCLAKLLLQHVCPLLHILPTSEVEINYDQCDCHYLEESKSFKRENIIFLGFLRCSVSASPRRQKARFPSPTVSQQPSAGTPLLRPQLQTLELSPRCGFPGCATSLCRANVQACLPLSNCAQHRR